LTFLVSGDPNTFFLNLTSVAAVKEESKIEVIGADKELGQWLIEGRPATYFVTKGMQDSSFYDLVKETVI